MSLANLANLAEPVPQFDEAAPIPDISVVLVAWNEGKNITPLLQRIKKSLLAYQLNYEIIVVDGGSKDSTVAEARAEGANCFVQKRIGYGGAIREGFQKAKGQYVLTMDCDLSHPPELFPELWKNRDQADVIVGSRFVSGGESEAPFFRRVLSVVLNKVFSNFLAVPVKDSSSGYRLYRRAVLQPENYTRENFNILQEILVKAYSDGYAVKEVALKYEERKAGSSHVSFVKFCLSYLPTLYHLWLLRNSTEAADYDDRAYNSRHFLQRYWQRTRTEIVLGYLEPGGQVVDLGCGSSRSVQARSNTVAVDSAIHKLRFLKRKGLNCIAAEFPNLPLKSASFDQVVCSQLLPYLPMNLPVFNEINRLLRDDGTVIIAVPDSGRLQWRLIGFLYHKLLPNVYKSKQQTNYTRTGLIDALAEAGFRTLAYKYVCGSELVLKARKVENCRGRNGTSST